MGQYYYVINIDKKEYLMPHTLGDGLKLWEILAGGGTMKALGLLLASGNGRGGGDLPKNELVGRWAGDRIVIAGDYDDKGKFIEDKEQNLHNFASDNFLNISLQLREFILSECELTLHERWDKDWKEE